MTAKGSSKISTRKQNTIYVFTEFRIFSSIESKFIEFLSIELIISGTNKFASEISIFESYFQKYEFFSNNCMRNVPRAKLVWLIWLSVV